MKLAVYTSSILPWHRRTDFAALENNDFTWSVSWSNNHFLPRNDTPVRISLETSCTGNLYTLVITAGWLFRKWIPPFLTYVSFDTCRKSTHSTSRPASAGSTTAHEESGKFLYTIQISTLLKCWKATVEYRQDEE